MIFHSNLPVPQTEELRWPRRGPPTGRASQPAELIPLGPPTRPQTSQLEQVVSVFRV